jgi:FkbM family methyltransferase
MINTNFFIDCGTHFGEGLDFFINHLKIDESWEVHSFEANPKTFESFPERSKYKNLKIEFHNLAVSDEDGHVIFNRETPKGFSEEIMMGGGSSFMSLDEWNPWGTFKESYTDSIKVASLDFDKFVSSLDSSNIFCKMDIEGAEFQVLEKMILSGSIEKIKKIWIEFHDNFFTNPEIYRNRKHKILNVLSEKNIEYVEWH